MFVGYQTPGYKSNEEEKEDGRKKKFRGDGTTTGTMKTHHEVWTQKAQVERHLKITDIIMPHFKLKEESSILLMW